MDDSKSAVKLEARAIPVPRFHQRRVASGVGQARRARREASARPLRDAAADNFPGWMKIKAATDAQYATAMKGWRDTFEHNHQ